MTDEYTYLTCEAEANCEDSGKYNKEKYPINIFIAFDGEEELDGRINDFFLSVQNEDGILRDVSSQGVTKYKAYFGNMKTVKDFAESVLSNFNMKREFADFAEFFPEEAEKLTPSTVVFDAHRSFNYVNRGLN